MRILLVEDDADLRVATAACLRAAGYLADEAEDGEKALFLGTTNDYDLVVTDLMMPKLDGKGLCRKLRAAGRQMPILLLSVHADVPTKVDLLDAGADDFLAKPFAKDELLARVRALSRRVSTGTTAGPIVVGGIVLDAARHEVRQGSRQVVLRPKEFALLEYFMRNAGFLLTRGQILEHVWDMNADPFSNTVEAHVASLRRKIGARHIQTVTNLGYKFIS